MTGSATFDERPTAKRNLLRTSRELRRWAREALTREEWIETYGRHETEGGIQTNRQSPPNSGRESTSTSNHN